MSWVAANLPLIAEYLGAHLAQCLPAIAAALVLSIPIARLAQGSRALRALLVSGSSLLYAVPSLALFVILPIILGTGIRDVLNVVVALTLYGLALLVPATSDALDAVEPRALDAATAMGMGRMRRFLTVELPLAGPTILNGLRVVAVSTVSLTTVGAVLGVRSLGRLFTDGFQRGLTAEILTGLVMTLALALVLDGLIILGGRLALPWTRRPGTPEPLGDGPEREPKIPAQAGSGAA
ncbi:ABC transporter permease subunit [Actinomyces bowdenii]|uniref:ABC transporter permease n=1 Tax=Actinomyces bowdenii TaxID=131109 RepID=UPI001ABCCFA2|nr:ABC transporter permease subunit [Actinomyces bowdenii]MBO3725610.1 ABC transporter permease subunit [Actinomyces bowdenii]